MMFCVSSKDSPLRVSQNCYACVKTYRCRCRCVVAAKVNIDVAVDANVAVSPSTGLTSAGKVSYCRLTEPYVCFGHESKFQADMLKLSGTVLCSISVDRCWIGVLLQVGLTVCLL